MYMCHVEEEYSVHVPCGGGVQCTCAMWMRSTVYMCHVDGERETIQIHIYEFYHGITFAFY